MERRRDRAIVRSVRHAALVGVIADKTVTWPQRVDRIARQHRLHRLLVGGVVELDAAAQNDDAAVLVGQARRAVLRFAQDRRITAVIQRMLHGGGRLAQAACDHFDGDRIDVHAPPRSSMTSVPVASTVTVWPASTTVVESNCSTTAGPSNLA